MAIWVALVGIVGTLVGTLGTQALTHTLTRRREDVKWQRERQQRVLDAQTAAFTEALAAVNRWHDELDTWGAYLFNPESIKPEFDKFPELDKQARNALAAIELLCSDGSSTATRETHFFLSRHYYRLQEAGQHADMNATHYGVEVDSTESDGAVENLRKVYRAELVALSSEQLAIPSPPSAPTS